MQKVKMGINGKIMEVTPSDLLRVTYVETSGEILTVEGRILEDELFGVYTISGKITGEKKEKNYYFMTSEVVSMEIIGEKIEEMFEVNKLLISEQFTGAKENA